ncbi:hypothetical protein QE193_23450 (plasmid) [Arsenophonus nasoniae]|uniref:hypothetical protein n=1 Tax=Arsenophonus nasoniae TaxID=638 RepID=UPI00246886AD|nr:hypothetical protein [Arsenophonus nasoniae]WGM18168.1 hypothetical protein QE193_23450 [Arsenophonus nasoniae]
MKHSQVNKCKSTSPASGEVKSLKAFVATLGYSRASYVKFFDNERAESWQQGFS